MGRLALTNYEAFTEGMTDWHSKLLAGKATPDRKRLYDEYLRSPEWRARRNAAVNRAGDACQLCPSTSKLHVHHRTYDRVGAEEPGDLTVLCERCHGHFHKAAKPKPKPSGKRKKQKRKRPQSLRAEAMPAADLELVLAASYRMTKGIPFTAKELSRRVPFPAERTGKCLNVLASQGKIQRDGKGQWHHGTRKGPLAQQNEKLHALQQRNKTVRERAQENRERNLKPVSLDPETIRKYGVKNRAA